MPQIRTKDKPNYLPMHAEQILAPPHGLVWELRAGKGLMRISGSDGFDGESSWVRFWLMNCIPVVRVGGSSDHARAAFGRVVAEAVFWAPAALLPGNGATNERCPPMPKGAESETGSPMTPRTATIRTLSCVT